MAEPPPPIPPTRASKQLTFDPAADLPTRSAAAMAALAAFPDPQERFGWLVEQARTREPLPAEFRRPEFLVPGCLVRIWLVPEFRDDRCWFRLDSDAASLKAVAGLICDFYNGQSPAAVAGTPPKFLDELNLGINLAESRRRTVWRIREMIRAFARSQSPAP